MSTTEEFRLPEAPTRIAGRGTRAIVWWYVDHGFKQVDIARKLGITPQAVNHHVREGNVEDALRARVAYLETQLAELAMQKADLESRVAELSRHEERVPEQAVQEHVVLPIRDTEGMAALAEACRALAASRST